MSKRIVVMSCGGTVGKTTMTVHFLAPRIPGAEIISVESLNENAANFGMDTESLRGDDFEKLYKRMIVADNAIIDVGASNVESFLAKMTTFDNGHDEFDYFIIPTKPGAKETKETLQAIYALNEIGVPANKIKIIFNQTKRSVVEEFSDLIDYLKTKKYKCDWDPKAVVYQSDSFDVLSMRKLQLEKVLSDDTDYKAQLRSLDRTAKDYQREFNRLSDIIVLQKTAKSINKNFDELWSVLFDFSKKDEAA